MQPTHRPCAAVALGGPGHDKSQRDLRAGGVCMLQLLHFLSAAAVMEGYTQVHVQVTPWLSHVFRLYDGARHVEFEWEAGPLPTDDGGIQVRH